MLVRHGSFWRNETPQITGRKHRRLRTLIANDINLFAYHLPLDSHRELGNNVQIGARLGLIADGRFADQDLGWVATLGMDAAPARAFQRDGRECARPQAARFRRRGQGTAARGVVHGRRARLFRKGHRGRRGRVSQRGSFRADHAHCGGVGRGLHRGRPSRDRALRRAGGGRTYISPSSSISSIFLSTSIIRFNAPLSVVDDYRPLQLP